MHIRGHVERPWWWEGENALFHIVLTDIQAPQDEAAFFTELHQELAGQETFIFVHGYSNTFAG